MKRRYDKEKWDKTQITTLEEFESIMAKAAVELAKKAMHESQGRDLEQFELEIEKKAQAAGQVSQKLQQVRQDTEVASKELGNFLQKAESLAEDEFVDGDDQEITEEEQASIAKESLLEELSMLASEAARSGNYKTAYKIERAADSILHDEE